MAKTMSLMRYSAPLVTQPPDTLPFSVKHALPHHIPRPWLCSCDRCPPHVLPITLRLCAYVGALPTKHGVGEDGCTAHTRLHGNRVAEVVE